MLTTRTPRRIQGFYAIQWISAAFVQRSHCRQLGGIWGTEPRVIVIDATLFNDPQVVSHEILHDSLGGDIKHANPLFAN